jgi:ribosome biogenesis GTPase / thiamine phosphate phosphatase
LVNTQNKSIPEWIIQKTKHLERKDFQIVRISGVHKNIFSVQKDSEEVLAELSGNLMFNIETELDYPTVGDWVYAQFFNQNNLAIIHEIIPRRTTLKRKTAGKKIAYQLIAANVDIALIIQSLDQDFNLRRLERYITIVKEGNIQLVILLSKSDLLSETELEVRISDVLSIIPDVKVIAFSNLNKNNLIQVTELLEMRKTYCLIGSSGVGKTTLLNHILETDKFKTQEVRKDGKGKHTTTNRQLINFAHKGTIIDTPGMRELGLTDSQKGISKTFQEIAHLANKCLFKDCTHTIEKGCAILAALADGTLSPERYNNYIKMKKESAHYEMSYFEKRKKERQTGKLYKNILKDQIRKKKWQ